MHIIVSNNDLKNILIKKHVKNIGIGNSKQAFLT